MRNQWLRRFEAATAVISTRTSLFPDDIKTESIATWYPDIDELVDVFISSVLEDRMCPLPMIAEDAAEALAIVLAAYRSSQGNKPVLMSYEVPC